MDELELGLETSIQCILSAGRDHKLLGSDSTLCVSLMGAMPAGEQGCKFAVPNSSRLVAKPRQADAPGQSTPCDWQVLLTDC